MPEHRQLRGIGNTKTTGEHNDRNESDSLIVIHFTDVTQLQSTGCKALSELFAIDIVPHSLPTPSAATLP